MQVVLAGTAGLAAAGKLTFSRLKRRRAKDEDTTPEPEVFTAEDPAPSE
jgi:hypothetical protein